MAEDFPVRVYYEDTDAGGVLYHAAVIRYMDRGRTEWLRKRGYTLASLEQEHQRVFAVHSLSARYLLPGRLDDELMVRTRLSGRARLSLDFSQALWREGECLAEATIKVACLSTDTWSPAPLPPELYEKCENNG